MSKEQTSYETRLQYLQSLIGAPEKALADIQQKAKNLEKDDVAIVLVLKTIEDDKNILESEEMDEHIEILRAKHAAFVDHVGWEIATLTPLVNKQDLLPSLLTALQTIQDALENSWDSADQVTPILADWTAARGAVYDIYDTNFFEATSKAILSIQHGVNPYAGL